MTTFKKIYYLAFLFLHCGLIIIANLSEIKNLGEEEAAIQQFFSCRAKSGEKYQRLFTNYSVLPLFLKCMLILQE